MTTLVIKQLWYKLKRGYQAKPKKLTLEEMVLHINREYHFTGFDENLINEIYSNLLDYGSVEVAKMVKYKYIVSLTTTNDDIQYEISQTGMIVLEDD